MRLTGPQLRTVRFYLEHRDHSPTWSEFLRRFARTLVVWTAVGVAAAYLCVAVDMPMLAYLYAGMLFGAALREVRHHHHVCRAWPAIAAFVDWERVQALAAASDDEPGRVPPPGRP